MEWKGRDVPGECAQPGIGQWMGLKVIIVVVGVHVARFVYPA